MQVVDVDDAGQRAQLAADRVEIDVLGRDLQQHADRLAAEPPRARHDPDADDRGDDRVDRLPADRGAITTRRRSHRPTRRRRPSRRRTRPRTARLSCAPARSIANTTRLTTSPRTATTSIGPGFDVEVAVDQRGSRPRPARSPRPRTCSTAFTSDARISRRNSPNVRDPVVRRPVGDHDRAEREADGHGVGEHVGGVGEQREGAGDERGDRLDHHERLRSARTRPRAGRRCAAVRVRRSDRAPWPWPRAHRVGSASGHDRILAAQGGPGAERP